MQAVADSFPILLTALLLSLALCWWGLTNYAIASRKKVHEDKEKPRSAGASSGAFNQQFASQQAVNNQTLSRNRKINHGGRISAELKSVAALQTQNRQRQRIEHHSASPNSVKSISAARLDIDSALEQTETSGTTTHVPNLGDSDNGRAIQNSVSQRNGTAQSNSAAQSNSTVPGNNALHDSSSVRSNDQLKNNSKTNGLSVPATRHSEKTHAQQGIVGKEAIPTAVADASRRQGNLISRSETSAAYAGSANSKLANDVALGNDQPAKGNNGLENSERSGTTSTVSSSTKRQGERVHHAAAADNTKITAAASNAPVDGGRRNSHRPGHKTASANAPKVAAYQLPAGSSGSLRSLGPLTEVKTSGSGATVKGDNASVLTSATNSSATNQTPDGAVTATAKNTDASRTADARHDGNWIDSDLNSTAGTTASPQGSDDNQINNKAKTRSALQKFLGGKNPREQLRESSGELNTGQAADSETKPHMDKRGNADSTPTASSGLTSASASVSTSAPVSGSSTTSGSTTTSATTTTPASAATLNSPKTSTSVPTSDSDLTSASTTTSAQGPKNTKPAAIPDDKSTSNSAVLTSQTNSQNPVDHSSAAGKKSLADDGIAGNKKPLAGDDSGTANPLMALNTRLSTSRLDSLQTDPTTAENNNGNIVARPGRKAGDLKTGSTQSNSGLPERRTSANTTDTATTTNSYDTAGAEKYQTAAKLKQMSPSDEAQLQLKTSDIAAVQPSGSINRKAAAIKDNADSAIDNEAISALTAFSGAADLESTLALEAKDQLIKELKARVADLEADQKTNTAPDHSDDRTENSDYKQQLAEATEALQLSNNKISKLQSTLQSLQSRVTNTQSVPTTPARTTAHNRPALSSKVRVLDVRSVS